MQLIEAQLTINGQVFRVPAGKSIYDVHFYAELQLEKHQDTFQAQLSVHPKTESCHLEMAVIVAEVIYQDSKAILQIGEHSGLKSSFVAPENYTSSKSSSFLNSLLENFGVKANATNGLRSHGRTQVLTKSNHLLSIEEKNVSSGPTLFEHQTNDNRLIIKKLFKPISLEHSFAIFDLHWSQDKYTQNYKVEAGYKKHTLLLPTCTSASDILSALNTWQEHGFIFDYCLIPQTWQRIQGDPFNIHPQFPEGLPHFCQQIKNTGANPMLMWSPFLVAENSFWVRDKPNCLLKSANGKPVFAPNNTTDSTCYILDVQQKDVQSHLYSIFYSIVQQWGFQYLMLSDLHLAGFQGHENTLNSFKIKTAFQLLADATQGATIFASEMPLSVVDDNKLGICFDALSQINKSASWFSRFSTKKDDAENPHNLVSLLSLFNAFPETTTFCSPPFRSELTTAASQNEVLWGAICSDNLIIEGQLEDFKHILGEQLADVWQQAKACNKRCTVHYKGNDVFAITYTDIKQTQQTAHFRIHQPAVPQF